MHDDRAQCAFDFVCWAKFLRDEPPYKLVSYLADVAKHVSVNMLVCNYCTADLMSACCFLTYLSYTDHA